MASNKLGELRHRDLRVTLQVTPKLLEIKALNPLRGLGGWRRQCMIIAIIWLPQLRLTICGIFAIVLSIHSKKIYYVATKSPALF